MKTASSILFSGLFIGFVQTFFTLSITVLIFSGKLTEFLGAGISMMLIGYIVLSLFIAKFSPLVSSISSTQEAPAIILMTILHSHLLTDTSLNHEELFIFVIGIIVITTVLTGLFFYLLGQFELGDLIRYMPYPVIAGFLAGTGWAMLKGGIALSLGIQQELSLTLLFSEQYLAKCLSGLSFGLLLFIILKYYKSSLILPIFIILSVLFFYSLLAINDISIEHIKSQAWLLNSLPELQQIDLAVFNLHKIHWLPLLQQLIFDMPAMVLVATMSFLLNINAIEILTKQDINLNKSLKVTGIANVFSGLCGSTVGFSAVDMTALSYRFNVVNRLTILVSISVTSLVLAFCLPLLNFLPNFVIGGFLIYLGMDFIYDWVYKIRLSLTKTDYTVVLLVLLMIMLSGFVQGVTIGIGVALLLFVINFSHLSIIKNSLSGSDLQSNNQRGDIQQQLLIEHGKETQLVMLTGFIFFATANQLCVQLKERANAKHLPPLRYILLDWRQVTGMDSSTVYSLQKIQQLAATFDIQLLFSNVPDNIESILQNNLDYQTIKVFSELNHGLDWCETDILNRLKKQDDFLTFEQILINSGVNSAEVKTILNFFHRKEIPTNHYLIKQGDTAKQLYFIESGCLDVFSEAKNGHITYLQRISMGLFVGEIGLFLRQPRSASIVTIKPSVVYEISLADLDLMRKQAITAYAEFERVMILLLAKRLFIADARVKRLLL